MIKLLIFHPALAPYRIDQFNALSQQFELEVVFIFDNVWNHKFDQSKLLSQLYFKYSFLLNGPCYKGRVFRFGMLKIIKGFNPDIILGYEYSFTTQYLVLLKFLGLISSQIGSMIDDSIDICNHSQSRSRHFVRKHTVKRLNHLVVLSDEVSLFYQKTFGFKENQIIVSAILQEPERLRNNADQLEHIAKEYACKFQLKGKKVLLFVGRFIPEKALANFINTISSFLQTQNDLVLILVGDGVEKLKIDNLIKEKHLENRIFLPGRYEGCELYAWYLCASGFVLASLSEAFGAVVNEALIFGLKVFCSEYAGAASLIKPGSGIIFDPLSESDTIEKLKDFIDSIAILEDIVLSNKPSLMSNFQTDFIKEWGKLIND